MAMGANDVNTFPMPIKGLLAHVTSGFAQVTAQNEALLKQLFMKMLLVLTMIDTIVSEEPICCIRHCTRLGQVGPL